MATEHESEFQFLDPGDLVDEDLRLVLLLCYRGDASRGMVPSYEFQMQRVPDKARIGGISLRVGDNEHITYVGHIGYGVAEAHRGHHYAARATRLLIPLARRHGMKELWITTDPENYASQRTCELVGAEYVETVTVPPYDSLYGRGDRSKLRYRLRVDTEDNELGTQPR
ncbi:MAG: GNAT family N-acetyltransferase [Anaerolineae bacterium]